MAKRMMLAEAANELARLRAENKELRKACKMALINLEHPCYRGGAEDLLKAALAKHKEK